MENISTFLRGQFTVLKNSEKMRSYFNHTRSRILDLVWKKEGRGYEESVFSAQVFADNSVTFYCQLSQIADHLQGNYVNPFFFFFFWRWAFTQTSMINNMSSFFFLKNKDSGVGKAETVSLCHLPSFKNSTISSSQNIPSFFSFQQKCLHRNRMVKNCERGERVSSVWLWKFQFLQKRWRRDLPGKNEGNENRNFFLPLPRYQTVRDGL